MRAPVKAVVTAILTATLLAGPAFAQAEEVARLAPSTPFEGDPLALLLDSGEGAMRLQTFEVRADALRLHEWSGGVHHVSDVGVRVFPNQNVSSVLHEVVVTLAVDQAQGFVGIHPAGGDAASFESSSPVRLESATRTEMNPDASTGSTTNSARRNPDSVPYYYHTVAGPHLLARAQGVVRFEGRGAIQIHGPDLLVASREETRRVDTGTEDDGAMAGVTKERWVILEGENVTLRIGADAPWTLAMAEVRTADARITPEGVVLEPASASPRAPGSSSSRPMGIALVAVVGAVVLGGGAGVVVLRRRRHAVVHDETESWDPEDCLRRAALHIESSRFDRALEWVTRARELAPTSARAAATQGFILEQLNRPEASLAAYEAAAGFAPEEGEHDVEAARVAMRLGRPVDDVERVLARALWKSPPFVQQVEEDPAFRPLAERPAFRRAVDNAWAAFTRELSRDAGDDVGEPGRSQPNH
jgi:hypothetical protein